MTEAEWLACQNPILALAYVRDKPSQRKLRLFACACVSQILPLAKLHQESACTALAEVLEYADGAATKAAMKRIRERLAKVRASTPSPRTTADDFVFHAIEDTSTEKRFPKTIQYSQGVLKTWGDGLSVPAQPILVRCIFPNPFRPAPPTLDPAWLRWHDGTIPRLAHQMYDSRDFASMPILADALEEAGCTSADLLDHCRGPGPHVRGCWVVDLLLGKQ